MICWHVFLFVCHYAPKHYDSLTPMPLILCSSLIVTLSTSINDFLFAAYFNQLSFKFTMDILVLPCNQSCVVLIVCIL